MKVKHIKNNGRKVWMVDGTIDGKRKRLEFDTEKQAKGWLKFHKSDT